jgi:hypothetical protein
MRRLVQSIALAAGLGTSGCETLLGEPEGPAGENGAAMAGDAEQRFAGRWYALDENLSCQPDKVVTFADGSAVLEGEYSLVAAAVAATDATATDDANAELTPLTLPYSIETDEDSGMDSLVVDRGDTKDQYWLAGPDYLLALNADGYDVLAHCD